MSEKDTDRIVYGKRVLPPGIRSRAVHANGITLHALEAGFEGPGRRCIVLVHGFPELAYSWRKLLLPLAEAGFHVIAPDLRGYGRSWGAGVSFDEDLYPFTMLNHVSDILGLIRAFGHQEAEAVVGHDFGSSVAAWCALLRPDVFSSLVMMSAPFAGPPELPEDAPPSPGASRLQTEAPAGPYTQNIHEKLAALPRPRKHYQRYYATREANENMWHCPQGVHAFLRAYYHYKSADWEENKPFRLASWSAADLAKMPTYYIMDRDKGMAETVAAEMPTEAEVSTSSWLPDEDLRIYSDEYERNGFQGGLQNYRIRTDSKYAAALRAFSGRRIEVPSCFISGAKDWGTYQKPGALETMAETTCERFGGIHLVEGAGHWVQQEQPEKVNTLLADFLTTF